MENEEKEIRDVFNNVKKDIVRIKNYLLFLNLIIVFFLFIIMFLFTVVGILR